MDSQDVAAIFAMCVTVVLFLAAIGLIYYIAAKVACILALIVAVLIYVVVNQIVADH